MRGQYLAPLSLVSVVLWFPWAIHSKINIYFKFRSTCLCKSIFQYISEFPGELSILSLIFFQWNRMPHKLLLYSAMQIFFNIYVCGEIW